jgi:hypothetical protein
VRNRCPPGGDSDGPFSRTELQDAAIASLKELVVECGKTGLNKEKDMMRRSYHCIVVLAVLSVALAELSSGFFAVLQIELRGF